MDGIKKTALFLSGLEWKTVDLLLGRLDPETARAVRREMMSIGSVAARETDRLAHEFLHEIGGRTADVSPGPAYTTYVPPKSKAPRFSTDSFSPKPTGSADRPFGFLRTSEAENIVRELSGEHPQTIAVVLAHLPASLAGDVLGTFPASLQFEVAGRLAEFEEMDPQILHEIETTLRERFEHRMRLERRRSKGNAVMKEILKATDPGTRNRILSHLDRKGESGTTGSRFSLDDLRKLGDSDLATLFHSVDAATAMLALVGADPDLIERITKRFSPTEERRMRQELKRLGPIDERDIRRAREAILGKAELLLSEE